jgi:hypothetical protein
MHIHKQVSTSTNTNIHLKAYASKYEYIYIYIYIYIHTHTHTYIHTYSVPNATDHAAEIRGGPPIDNRPSKKSKNIDEDAQEELQALLDDQGEDEVSA